MESKDVVIKEVKGFSSAYPNMCKLKLLPNIDKTWINIQDDVGTSMTIKLSNLSDFIKGDVLDKIKFEIENLTYYSWEVSPKTVIDDVLAIIDKYKAESEDKK